MSLLNQFSRALKVTNNLLKSQQSIRLLSTTQALSSNKEASGFADINAFIARLKLDKLNPALINNILERGDYIDNVKNGQLRQLGLTTLQFFVVEKYLMEYPRLNRKFLEEIYTINFDLLPNSKLVRGFGLDKLLSETVQDPKELKFKASKSFLSIIGAIYQQEGPLAARDFINSYITPRNIKLEEILEFEPAKVILSQFIQKQGKPAPITRLLKESGRLSNRPVFIVGVFSGTEKLSEGYGSSLKMAEYRACKNYLVDFFGKKRIDFELPSSIQDSTTSYKPAALEPTPLVL